MADSLKTDGKLLGVNAIEVISEKFKKRKFWLETDSDSQWPQVIEFELVQDKVSAIEKYKVGDLLSIGFNLRGRRYVSKKTGAEGVINSLNAWFIDKAKPAETGTTDPASPSDNNDLPF